MGQASSLSSLPAGSRCHAGMTTRITPARKPRHYIVQDSIILESLYTALPLQSYRPPNALPIQLVNQGFGLLQVDSIKPFGEPIVNLGKHRTCFVTAAL